MIWTDVNMNADIVRCKFADSFKITFDTEIAQWSGFTLELDYVDQEGGMRCEVRGISGLDISAIRSQLPQRAVRFDYKIRDRMNAQ